MKSIAFTLVVLLATLNLAQAEQGSTGQQEDVNTATQSGTTDTAGKQTPPAEGEEEGSSSSQGTNQ